MDLGSAITRCRTVAGIEKKDLARRAGITEQYMRDVENGNAMPSILRLETMAREMGFTVPVIILLAQGIDVTDQESIEMQMSIIRIGLESFASGEY